MNRGKKLLILVAVLAVAVFAVWGVAELTKPEVIPIGTESGETILTVDVSSLTRLSWNWGAEQFDFNYSGTAWTCNIQEGYVPNTALMAEILVELSDVRAEKIIDQPGELSLYGLDAPLCTVTAGDKVLKFGDASSLNDTHYLSIGDGKVYMVDSNTYSCFAYTRKELVQFDTIPAMTALTGMTFENSSGTLVLENIGENDRTYSSHYTWFLKDDATMISQDMVDGILLYLQDLTWIECVDTGAADLSVYGLDTPAVKCSTESTDGSFSFWVGNASEQGHYACVAGSDKVYLIDSTAAQLFEAVSTDMLACLDVLQMDWSTVTSVEVTVDGQTSVLTAGTDGGWTLNGSEVEALTVLETINQMTADVAQDLSVEGLTQEVKLVINRNTESFSRVELTFYRLDGTNCVMQLDTNAPLLVPRDEVVSLKEAFNTLILG